MKKPPRHYCDYAPGHPVHAAYHDKEYGFPVKSDRKLFERLALEIMQAGLSWETILRKRKAFNRAFDGFNPVKVAAYGNRDKKRLLADDGIIRNRLKIEAVIYNAQQVLDIKYNYGSFSKWLSAHHPQGKTAWVKLFKKQFKFMGPEIVGEFLMSTGYLPGAHHNGCKIHKKISKLSPPYDDTP